MYNDLEKAKKILKKYNQEHLLNFYEELTDNEKENLIKEILELDFEEILSLYKNSKMESPKSTISELEHIEKEKLTQSEIKKYSEIGEQIIKNKEFAVVTMAGGQGTRLGYKGPKGTYEIKFEDNKKSLFQIMCENIKEANKLYGVVIPWYIMTSKDNNAQTINYFMQKNYFDYPKEKIVFFIQDTIPLIDIDGKIILQEYYKIKEVSNGNGNVFKAMKKASIIEKMKQDGIKWVSFSGVDNILIKNVDTLFLGLIINKKEQIGSKSIFKEEPLQKSAVFCRKNGKPSILDYDEIDLNLSEKKSNKGEYLYREINILSHIMSLDAIEKVSTKELPYHRTFKKNPIINEEGMKFVPTAPNSFKFENFIFDGFKYFDNMILLRVKKEDEFAPIKDFTGIHTPETAKELYENYMLRQSNLELFR